MVARLAQQREAATNKNNTGRTQTQAPPPPPPPIANTTVFPESVERNAATITNLKMQKNQARRARAMGVSPASLKKSSADDDSTDSSFEARMKNVASVGSGKGNYLFNKSAHKFKGYSSPRSGTFDNKNKKGDANTAATTTVMAALNNNQHVPSRYLTPPSPRRRAGSSEVKKTVVDTTPSNKQIIADRSGAGSAPSNNSNSSNIHIGLPSLLSQDDATIDSSNPEIVETPLFAKFEEAFNLTLRNNPGMLPGAPSVVDSIKHALYKARKVKAMKETEMRKQLEHVKSEKDTMEAELRKEMGATAMRRNELAKELEVLTKEQCMLQDSLTKQMEAVEAMKKEMQMKTDNVTAEKEELTTHLGFLSKSRAELEEALNKEMTLVEKDRDALQKIVAERKKLQSKKAENKELESKIEEMTQAASKEKKALHAEVADLKKFEEHIQQLRAQNDGARQSLEEEKGQLKEVTDTMQTKKSALTETKNSLEIQYQEEIDDLQAQIENTKMMHSKDMEMLVKNRVVSYLRRGGFGADAGEPGVDQQSGKNIESIIKSRVGAELQAKMKAIDDERKEMEEKRWKETKAEKLRRLQAEAEQQRAEAELQKRAEKKAAEMLKQREAERRRKTSIMVEDVAGDSDNSDDEGLEEKHSLHQEKSHKPSTSSSRHDDEMQKELNNLREELELVQVQSRNPRSTRKDGIREEIESIREEIRMSHTAASPSPYSLTSPHSATTPRARTTFQRNALISPRYTERTNNRASPGYGSSRYFGEEEEMTHQRKYPAPPLSARSRRRYWE